MYESAIFWVTDEKTRDYLQMMADDGGNFLINLVKGKVNTLSMIIHFKTSENIAENGNTEHLYEYEQGKS